LDGTRLTLETQLNALESANFNAQTLAALSNSQKALKQVHKDLNVTNVDSILDEMREQIETAQAIQEAISAPMGGETIDEVSCFSCNAYIRFIDLV
jgi:charged multivesicular body protein 4